MKNSFRFILLGLFATIICAQAEVVTETVDYNHEGAVLEGTWAYDNAATNPRPAVIIFHQWGGAGETEVTRAKMLAEQGYVVFVADIFGKGVRPPTPDQRRVLVTAYYSDRQITRARARAALDTVKVNPRVQPDAIAAIGYCFGGMVAIELARDGADLDAFVSIHGSLNTPNPADAKNIKSIVLVQHGGDDPNVPPDEVTAFHKEMEDATVNVKFTVYEGAVHAFTDKNAGDDPAKGAAYNEEADKASWTELLAFLAENVK